MEEELVVESGASVATNDFTHEIARYFKIYLETGLRGRLVPARAADGRRHNGLRTQIYQSTKLQTKFGIRSKMILAWLL
jgi:hypothetical protein